MIPGWTECRPNLLTDHLPARPPARLTCRHRRLGALVAFSLRLADRTQHAQRANNAPRRARKCELVVDIGGPLRTPGALQRRAQGLKCALKVILRRRVSRCIIVLGKCAAAQGPAAAGIAGSSAGIRAANRSASAGLFPGLPVLAVAGIAGGRS
eukprot:121639-Chlamydomonas_euryale.AAC.5